MKNLIENPFFPGAVIDLADRHLIIIGERATGKTLLAKVLAKNFKRNQVVYKNTDGLLESSFYFNDCTADTKLVIIDDVKTGKQLDALIHFASVNTIKVEKKGKEAITIEPKFFIIISDYSSDMLRAFWPSFFRRFVVLETGKQTFEAITKPFEEAVEIARQRFPVSVEIEETHLNLLKDGNLRRILLKKQHHNEYCFIEFTKGCFAVSITFFKSNSSLFSHLESDLVDVGISFSPKDNSKTLEIINSMV